MDKRLAPVRIRTFVVIAVVLLISEPWTGWWTLAPLLVALALFGLADRYTGKTTRPEYAMFGAWAGTEIVIAASVAFSGAPKSATLSWLAIPIVTLASRFSFRGILAGVGFSLVLLVGVAVLSDAGAVAHEPTLLLAPAALIVSVSMLTTALMQSDVEHRSRAVSDPLTGLLNRSALETRAEELEQQSTQTRTPVGLILADVDHFKEVNDRFGHEMGDEVLRGLADRIRRSLRSFDLAYRLGGEEFLALLPGANLAETTAIAERLCRAIECDPIEGVEVSVSCGVAASEDGPFKYKAAFASADVALYEAKTGGRNTVVASRCEPIRRDHPPVAAASRG